MVKEREHMRLFEVRSRRNPFSSNRTPRDVIPAAFEAVAEALQSGTGSVDACLVVGRQLAGDGMSLEEALRGLRTTSQVINGLDPAYHDVEGLCLAWSESTLGYLHQLSCEDPLTGLASLAHLRSRLSELYRGELRTPGPHHRGSQSARSVQDTYALIVLDLPASSVTIGDGVSRALQMAQLGAAARTVFPGSETTGRLGLRRIGVLVRRDAGLGRRVALLRTLATDVERGGQPTRVWIEGLPESDDGAAQLLDELSRTIG
jgi:hypothetical protein